MGKQTARSKKPESFGKGKVTPVQVAFIVDRYLSDNNYSQTRTIFRSEASTLISKSPVREAPKSLLSLGAMLDEYICLKEQKVMLDQEKSRLEQEKLRVQTLLQGMQYAMNAYNVSGSTPSLPISAAPAEKSIIVIPQTDPIFGSPSGQAMHKTPIVTPPSMPSNTVMDPANFSTPITSNQNTKKRKGSNVAPNAPLVAKKSRSRLPNKKLAKKGINVESESNEAANNQEKAQQLSVSQISSQDCVANGSPAQGSSVVKNLFNQSSLSPQTNSSGLQTPPRVLTSQSDKSISPVDIISAANSSNKSTPRETTPTNCTIISSKTVIMSPYKQKTYYSMERNHCISTSSPSPLKTNLKKLGKRDHVKGRLDFDGSDGPMSSESPVADGDSTPESEEGDIFDIDFPNLDFSSISELLVDFDIDCGGINYSCQPALSSITTISGPTQVSGSHDFGSNQVMSEYSSTVTEVLTEKDMNLQGLDSRTAVKSITKSIKILSPAKKT